jgi:hypothetical protein
MECFLHREQFVKVVEQHWGGDRAPSFHLSPGQSHQKQSGAFGELTLCAHQPPGRYARLPGDQQPLEHSLPVTVQTTPFYPISRGRVPSAHDQSATSGYDDENEGIDTDHPQQARPTQHQRMARTDADVLAQRRDTHTILHPSQDST